MSDDIDEVILGGSADSGSEAYRGESPILGEPADDDAIGVRRRVRARRETPRHGSFGAWLVCDASLRHPMRAGGEGCLPEPPARRCVAGLCLVTWAYKAADAPARATFTSLSTDGSVAWTIRGMRALGFIEYTVTHTWPLQELAPVADEVDLRSAAACLKLHRAARDHTVVGEAEHVAGLVRRLDHSFDSVLPVHPVILERLCAGMLPMVAASCKVTRRTTWRGRIPNHPPTRDINEFVRDALRAEEDDGNDDDVRAADAETAYERALLALPENDPNPEILEDEHVVKLKDKKRGIVAGQEDPMKLLHACSFAHFLRSCASFTPALNAGHRYDHGWDAPKRNADDDVHASTIRLAKQTLDVVDLLVLRREFLADMETDNIRHITLNSDSSPTTGEEIQGQVAIVLKRDGTNRKIVLPGASLAYGHYDSINKSVGLLWACWLIAGGSRESLEYFVSKVGCICTDMGVEMHLLLTPNILAAFWAWVQGGDLVTVCDLVSMDTRLFFNAIRISGWSHVMGNLLKTIFARCPEWPDYLEKVRLICNWLRNATYRKYMKKAIRDMNTAVLTHFTASLAKWRYETVNTVFFQMLGVRQICEEGVEPFMFQHVQDRETVQAAIAACKCPPMWRFIASSYTHITKPTEELRRWGLVCDCPHHVQARREDRVKHITCYMNSRRLKDASTHLKDHINETRDLARSLPATATEGDEALCASQRSLLLIKATELRTRTKYIDVVPWAFSQADSIEGARECIRQVEAFPLDQHDPYTIRVMARVGQDMKTRAEGGDVSAALQDQVDIIRLAMLDENAGEWGTQVGHS